MRFKDVFSIIGPSMVGPSSSHTAGAVRLGRTARHVLGAQPEQAEIIFYGSFATTYQGHGTDLAIIAGLLNYDTDDMRIKDALVQSELAGLKVELRTAQKAGVHPNTATLILQRGEQKVTVTGCSIGGGNIEIVSIDDFDVKFTAVYPTLLIFHADRRGILAEMTDIFKHADANIGYMEVDRKSRSGDALTVIESDEVLSTDFIDQISKLPDVYKIRVINLTAKGENHEVL
ncbi:L-serine ammonia-lyase, iron-sulfur-dependent, subunit beta [Paenibacillus anaericanus]|uniref:L-serine deaminase n=1 Tax=Paenibacillus anaericanus TaxID=170367 RepID=A0A3S1DCW9_9BACL|nr:L-serine ammonia-lyase, iron-sulfur-dependent subunit beta [Paenibacillus anaericanus]RUT41961.1 L-serine ammonia-lyase, iron-sulfur-dependent, subunit beta [Paenibacillus anaericanus]